MQHKILTLVEAATEHNRIKNMKSFSLLKLVAAIVFLAFHFKCKTQIGATRLVMVKDVITQCDLYRREDIAKYPWLLVGLCSPITQATFATRIPPNTTKLPCADGEVNVDDVKGISLEYCENDSSSLQSLKSFKNVILLKLSGSALAEQIKVFDIPVLVASNDSNAFPTVLDLSYNNLTHIENGLFEHQGALQILFLGGNRLQQVNANTFTGLYNIEEIHCIVWQKERLLGCHA